MKQILLAGLILVGELGASAQNAPVITVQPTAQIAFVGGKATFSVEVAGVGPFTYQWQFDGTNIPPSITTVAGDGRHGRGGDGGPATNAILNSPWGVTDDGVGNLYIADYSNQRIRRVGTNGVITTVVGNGTIDFLGDGGAATNAALDSPSSVASDRLGNLFFTDLGNNCVRRVGTNGIITTVAGIGMNNSDGGTFSGDGGPATNAELNFALAVAMDGLGNLFIADSLNYRVRKVDTLGIITTVAGNGTVGFSGDGGPATDASLNVCFGLGVDGRGNLYLADTYNQRIRRVDVDGFISTVAGGGSGGDGGAATNASLSGPTGVAFDGAGNFYIADRDHQTIRKVAANGIITTVAGSAMGYYGDNGTATNARLANPSGITVDQIGNLFIADRDNNRIREVAAPGPVLAVNVATTNAAGMYDVVIADPFGSVTSSVVSLTVLQPPKPTGQAVAAGGAAAFGVSATGPEPCGYQWYFGGAAVPGQTGQSLVLANVSAADAGNYTLVVTNCGSDAITSSPVVLAVGILPAFAVQPTNQSVVAGSSASLLAGISGMGPFTYQWRLNGAGVPPILTTIAGNGTTAYLGDGGQATNAGLNYPRSVKLDGSGNLYLADFNNNAIRKVDLNGIITTVAGTGIPSFSGDGGSAVKAALKGPTGVALDNSGNLFISDGGNSRIRKVATDGIISTIAGNGGQGYYGDGAKATDANLNVPGDLLADASGNIYIADTGNNAVRRVDTNGIISTVAGNPFSLPPLGNIFGDGNPANRANLNNPTSVSMDAFGSLFIADSQNNLIRRVDTGGIITTVTGNGGLGFSYSTGPATNAELAYPNGVVADSLGNVFIADTANNLLRKVDNQGVISIAAGVGPVYPANGSYSGDGRAAIYTSLNYPSSVAVDALGDLFIADSRNNRIREIIALGPVFQIDNVSPATVGDYDVVVTSPFGSVTSLVATVTLILPATITRQPQSQKVVIGGNARFSVSATNVLPLTYQWYFAGAALVGRTSNTLSLSNVGLTNAGGYFVVVTEPYASVTSSVAVLTVGFPPSISTQPTNQAALAGTGVNITVVVSGTGPFTYQWQFDGTNLPGIVTTAGNGTPAYSGDGGPAASAGLVYPYDVAAGPLGDLFIADFGNSRIRRVDSSGTITTVAGSGSAAFSGDGGPAIAASLNQPAGVYFDAAGNLFIADTYNQRVRKINRNQVITTVAGNGVNGWGGDGRAATSAFLSNPVGVTGDADGNLFITDELNNKIRKVDTLGIITTSAGNGGMGYSGDGGSATSATLNIPFRAAADASGNVFVADQFNQRIRKIASNGVISTVAGSGASNYSGDGDLAILAGLNDPSGVAVDRSGKLFIADSGNNRVRAVDTNGVITTVAGNGSAGFSGDGGAATNASLNNPSGLTVDGFGNIFVADTANARVRAIISYGPALLLNNLGLTNAGDYNVLVTSPYGSVTSGIMSLTIHLPPVISRQPADLQVPVGGNATLGVVVAGDNPLGYQWYFGETALTAQTNSALVLTDLGLANAGQYSVVVTNAYGAVASRLASLTIGIPPSIATQPASQTIMGGNNSNFAVTAAGTGPFTYQWLFNGTNLPRIITIAGTGTGGYSGDFGAATSAMLNEPYGLAVDRSGNLIIADYNNNRIRRVDANGIISTVAGGTRGGYAGDGGAATRALLDGPAGVAVDDSGSLLIVDTGNNRIRRVDANGIITTIAGNGAPAYAGDGGPATNASLFSPDGVISDGLGNLYISDSGNSVVRKVGTNGIINLFAGGGGPAGYSGDGGDAIHARLFHPANTITDDSGNVYLADTGNCVIRKVGTDGIIRLVAGQNGLTSFSGDGGAATNAGMNGPFGIVRDALGNLLIADTGDNRIRSVDLNGKITTIAGNGLAGNSNGNGWATNASLSNPSGVAMDGSGNLYIADTANHQIREVLSSGPILTVNHAGPANAGNYAAVVTSPYGSVTSDIVSLTVHLPPAITRPPQSQSVAVRGDVSFAISAIGSSPLFYQWYFDGTVLAARTNGALTLTNIQIADAGKYNVVVSNSYGSATSSLATLTVGFPPSITVQPTNQTAIAGNAGAFSVEVTGTGPLTYAWRFNGTNVTPMIITIAGNGLAGYSGNGGAATNSRLSQPYGLAVDRSGNLFIADYNNRQIRKVGTNGIISTVAGTGIPGDAGDGGLAINARFGRVVGVSVDGSGSLLIADTENNVIRDVKTNRTITTIVGTGSAGFSGDGGPATNANLSHPYAMIPDVFGGYYIVDHDNNVIRKVDTNGIIRLTAGGLGPPGYSGDGGPAVLATLFAPSGIAVDATGNLFIADTSDNVIRRVGTDGIITRAAGTLANGQNLGDGGMAVDATLNSPFGVATDGLGNLFIADSGNNRVRRVDGNGIITTIAGTGSRGDSGDGGAATNANLANPSGLAIDAAGNLFFADTGNSRIREIVATGPVFTVPNTTAAGAGYYDVVVTSPFGSVTSSLASLTVFSPPQISGQPQDQIALVGKNAGFNASATGTDPLGYQWFFSGGALAGQTTNALFLTNISFASAGAYTLVVTNLYGSATSRTAELKVGYAPVITSPVTNRPVIVGGHTSFTVGVSGTGPLTYQWRFNGSNLTAIITTVAGNGVGGYSGDGGAATNASLNKPYGLALDGSGNLFIADYNNNRIRKIDANGIISTSAGNGSPGFSGDGGAATNAMLNGPVDVAVDLAGDLLIAETANHRVRKVDTDGVISTLAGTGADDYFGDGGAATNAALSAPFAVTTDPVGNVFIADPFNHRIRRAGTNGIITTVAGGGNEGDGAAATNASLASPYGLAIDSLNNLLIADNESDRIRAVEINGLISTIAGGGTAGDGGAATNASLAAPFGVAVDSTGNIYTADAGNNRIRRIDSLGLITTVAGNGLRDFSGDGGLATNASLGGPSGVALDGAGNLFIADTDNHRIREVTLPGSTLAFDNVTTNNAGNYDVVVTSPYGSITSSVVTLKLYLPSLQAAIVHGNSLSLQLAGTAGQTYILQAATNLLAPVNWQSVYTNAADASGNWGLTNSNLPGNPAVYYRVTVP